MKEQCGLLTHGATAFFYERIVLWPYDEVTLEFKPDTLQAIISTPWLIAQIHSSQEDADAIVRLQANLKEGSISAADLPLVDRVFSPLSHLPFCYVLPRERPEATDEHHIKDDSLLVGSLETIFEKVTSSKLIFPNLSRTEWNWDVDAAIDFASVGDKVDPESLLSVMRRYHSLELLSSDRGNSVFADFRTMDDENFKTSMLKVLRQNHFVTQKCQDALAPAITLAKGAGSKVEEFRREERGHDKLLSRSITALGGDPESIPVSASTRALMFLLEYYAGRNFLAFCFAVDAFERNNFEDNDPMAQVLIDRGYERAAHFINAHKNINDHGNHENVAASFLFAMKSCDQGYAREAIRLMELLSLVMCSMSANSLDAP